MIRVEERVYWGEIGEWRKSIVCIMVSEKIVLIGVVCFCSKEGGEVRWVVCG